MRKPNIEQDGCELCRTEKNAVNNLTSDIERWAKETKENFALKTLLDKKRISASQIDVQNFACAQNSCRLVHCDDIANFSKSVKSLARVSSLNHSKSAELKTHVENLAFPSYHSVVLDFEKQPSARLVQSLRSLICCEHKLVIKRAIFEDFEEHKELKEKHRL